MENGPHPCRAAKDDGAAGRGARDGREQVIPGEELVPGDVFFLCEGDRVPADAVILTAVISAWMNLC